ncbi:retron St85 family RNA-directed DNA polymerase [Burkholderia diffusa]|uniref:retron St85 family RNA-directed DNA polymerase n=1 Tax=Burkholderia diffusa TaxID=488732 RepID=UPI002AB1C643|nr:retron St85 family RNA-directed DNA polymerase [Burkholderia diffusa]
MTINLRESLQESLGLSEAQLNRLIVRSPHTYKVYTIPKRTGGKRTIAQPAKETKFIQNWLIENIFNSLPVHSCASAYQPGSSIKRNADAHKAQRYLTKFDFKNFFTSIKSDDLIEHMRVHLSEVLDLDAIHDIARVSCIQLKVGEKLCLSIGAPSSPLLSNSIMFEFDSLVNEWCSREGVVYTRYADDMTFSTNERNKSALIEKFIRGVARDVEYPSLRFNNKKTISLSTKHSRRVTGIVINNQGQLSLGRDRKREISALVHKFTLSELPQAEVYRLQGLLGFACDVEPDFLMRMKRKYSDELICTILEIRKKSDA